MGSHQTMSETCAYASFLSDPTACPASCMYERTQKGLYVKHQPRAGGACLQILIQQHASSMASKITYRQQVFGPQSRSHSSVAGACLPHPTQGHRAPLSAGHSKNTTYGDILNAYIALDTGFTVPHTLGDPRSTSS